MLRRRVNVAENGECCREGCMLRRRVMLQRKVNVAEKGECCGKG